MLRLGLQLIIQLLYQIPQGVFDQGLFLLNFSCKHFQYRVSCFCCTWYLATNLSGIISAKITVYPVHSLSHLVNPLAERHQRPLSPMTTT